MPKPPSAPAAPAAPPDNLDGAMRANAYTLLANCLNAPPAKPTLENIAALHAPEAAADDIGRALTDLVAAASAASVAVAKNENAAAAEAIAEDYHELFIGLGRGKVVPYASYYLTGNMMDKPLVSIRAELAALGIQRREDSREPEDHAGILCELMAHLCADASATAYAKQKKVFEAHLAAWMSAYFADIENAAQTDFYRAAARFGAALIHMEKRYYAMMF